MTHKEEREYQVLDDSSFVFNNLGVFSLNKGAIVQMTPDCEVRHYSNSYLDEIVLPKNFSMASGEELLCNALMYYKRVEVLDESVFELLNLSRVALQYIESCKKTKRINCAVKRLIAEGRI